MTLIQFVTEVIKCLSEFQTDWKQVKNDLKLNDKMTFADWLSIFSGYAMRGNTDEFTTFLGG